MSYSRSADVYLIASPKHTMGLSVRLTSTSPSLRSGEVAIRVTLRLPETLFERPQLQATVTIPESAVSAPVIDASVLDNVREALQQQIGLDVALCIKESD